MELTNHLILCRNHSELILAVSAVIRRFGRSARLSLDPSGHSCFEFTGVYINGEKAEIVCDCCHSLLIDRYPEATAIGAIDYVQSRIEKLSNVDFDLDLKAWRPPFILPNLNKPLIQQ